MKNENEFSTFYSQGQLLSGGECAVHRAVQSIICAHCKLSIRQGELFIRKEVDDKLHLLACLCVSCVPFRLHLKDQKSRQSINQSAKLDDSRQQSEELRSAIEERLGPALDRGRRVGRRIKFTTR